jgi:hypothetical protein
MDGELLCEISCPDSGAAEDPKPSVVGRIVNSRFLDRSAFFFGDKQSESQELLAQRQSVTSSKKKNTYLCSAVSKMPGS